MDSARIRVFPGNGGTVNRPARRTVVEFPFAEVAPSIVHGSGAAYEDCKRMIKRLSPQQQAIVLANLCAHFGEHVR